CGGFGRYSPRHDQSCYNPMARLPQSSCVPGGAKRGEPSLVVSFSGSPANGLALSADTSPAELDRLLRDVRSLGRGDDAREVLRVARKYGPLGQVRGVGLTELSEPVGDWVREAAAVRAAMDLIDHRGTNRGWERFTQTPTGWRYANGTFDDDLTAPPHTTAEAARRLLLELWVRNRLAHLAADGSYLPVPRSLRELLWVRLGQVADLYRRCGGCGKWFSPSGPGHRSCSARCRLAVHRQKKQGHR